jgi:hypothetical protein
LTHRLTRSDWFLTAASAGAVLLFLAAQVAGRVADWAPYPSLMAPAVDPLPLTACLLLFAPVVTWRSRA